MKLKLGHWHWHRHNLNSDFLIPTGPSSTVPSESDWQSLDSLHLRFKFIIAPFRISLMSVELEGDKHEKLWFTDGNIILCVTTTTATNSVGERGCNVDTSTDEHGTQATEVDEDRGKKRRRAEEGSIDVSESTSSVKRILFRVHKSILSKHSPVFEGIFTLLDSSNHSERTDSDLELSYSTPDHRKSVNSVYEGVPIVELSDTKEQVDQLLGFFYV